ncbi:MAG: hypothetical protein J5I98_28655 [Phaeodactylibacter sp.]|nr:hypothetical protein [Phaeodactylibacter sp.]
MKLKNMSCSPFDDNSCEKFSDKRKIISLEETKGIKYKGINDNRKKVTCIRVDGCIIVETDKKCDFLLLECQTKTAFFIELKGSDLIKAVRQVRHTIEVILPKLQENNFSRVNARIILSRDPTPKIKSNEIKYLEQLLKKLRGNLKKQSRLLEEKI